MIGILLIDQIVKFWIKTNMALNESFPVFGSWFQIHFIENEGMAYGLKFGGEFGKIALTLFRLVAVVVGFFYMKRLVREKYHNGLLICGALILAGAAGNLIDSMFYGLIFSESPEHLPIVAQFLPEGGGYGTFLHGNVVDMLYFPCSTDTSPSGYRSGVASTSFSSARSSTSPTPPFQ